MVESLNKISNFNLGGIYKIQYVDILGISDLPDPLDLVVSSAITFLAGFGWLDFYGTLESIKFKQTEIKSDNGKSYDQVVSLFFPGQSSTTDNQILENEETRFLVLLTDNNDQQLLIGWPRGMQFFDAYDSKDKVSGRKGSEFQFKLKSRTKALYYDI